MTLENKLKASISRIDDHDIQYSFDDILKNSLSCDDCFDLETVIRPKINIQFEDFQFSVMPLAIVCSNLSGKKIQASHAEMICDDYLFSFPDNAKTFKKEIQDLIHKPIFANAIYRVLYRNLHVFQITEKQDRDVYQHLVNKIRMS